MRDPLRHAAAEQARRRRLRRVGVPPTPIGLGMLTLVLTAFAITLASTDGLGTRFAQAAPDSTSVAVHVVATTLTFVASVLG